MKRRILDKADKINTVDSDEMIERRPNETLHDFKIGSIAEMPPLSERNDYYSNNQKKMQKLLQAFKMRPPL